MSGHSKWATIKRQKSANDAKRGVLFTKLGNQIAVAARSGTDPSMNSALAMVVEKAKKSGMPAANIERSISRAGDKSAAAVEEVMYEGYGPGGVAILVECATDNKNRTYPDVRLAFSKNGGNMVAIESGADDVYAEGETGETVIHTAPNELAKVSDNLKDAGLEITDAELTFVPNNTIIVSDKEVARKAMNLMDALEDLDDVSSTHTNFDISDNLEV
jgi:transcriptional/translational regulatory protein YebC/TACO1